jgi:hypothetical protein
MAGNTLVRMLGGRRVSRADAPPLLVVNRLLKPIQMAEVGIASAMACLTDDSAEPVMHGLLVLMVSRFEVMLCDVLRYFLKSIPQKLPGKDCTCTKQELLEGDALLHQIDRHVHSLSYQRIDEVVTAVCETLSIGHDSAAGRLDEVIEIKESRNLLLHNNLVVSERYVTNAGARRRAERLGSKLPVDKPYVEYVADVLLECISGIRGQTAAKYADYTQLAVMRGLWEHYFKSPIMQFDDYWWTEYAKGGIPGAKRPECESSLSSGERLFLGLWRSHFTGGEMPIEGFDIRRFDPEWRAHVLHFLSVVGEI